MAVRISGLETLNRRIHYKKWSRGFLAEQSKMTRTVYKLLNDNPFSGLFSGRGEKIDKTIQRYEKSCR